MDLGIKGKTALVIGASQGLGQAIARGLAAEGANLVIASRSRDKLDALAGEINKASGVDVEVETVDMTDKASVAGLCESIAKRGDIDILINNAGGPPPSLSTGVDDEAWENALQSLLKSVVRITEAALEGMKQRTWGRVITIGSSGIIQPIANLALSNIARAAILGFSKTLAGEVAQFGITVNLVIPGRIETARLGQLDEARAKRTGTTVDDVREGFRNVIPARRYGRPEEFADAAVFLASERASYTTGHMFRVDGGMISNV
jgi:3-oxoacyl-[acyl-carrier protein] reductase